METASEFDIPTDQKLRTWLFNPFHYIAGSQALTIGLCLILAMGLVGAITNSHFDGLLDFHTGRSAPLWVFVSEGLISWIFLSLFLYNAGRLISSSEVRAIDVFGTQALARGPGLITALMALFPGYRRTVDRIAQVLAEGSQGTPPENAVNATLMSAPLADLAVFTTTSLVSILMIVWMVVLMYRAYVVSCNISGRRAIGSFITSMLICWIVSKYLISHLISAFA